MLRSLALPPANAGCPAHTKAKAPTIGLGSAGRAFQWRCCQRRRSPTVWTGPESPLDASESKSKTLMTIFHILYVLLIYRIHSRIGGEFRSRKVWRDNLPQPSPNPSLPNGVLLLPRPLSVRRINESFAPRFLLDIIVVPSSDCRLWNHLFVETKAGMPVSSLLQVRHSMPSIFTLFPVVHPYLKLKVIQFHSLNLPSFL